MKKWHHHVGSLVGVGLFLAAVVTLHHELRSFHYHDILNAVGHIPSWAILLSLAITIVDYWVLTLFEGVSLRYIQSPMKYKKIAFASFIGYAFTNSVGFSWLSGGSVRFRLYSAWGLSGFEIAKFVAFNSTTFMLGYFTLAGILFVIEPLSIPSLMHLPISSARPIGWIFILIVAGYLRWIHVKKEPIKIKDWEFPIPPLKLSLLQITIGAIDLILAAAALYVLLPSFQQIVFPAFVAIYLFAICLGVLSQIPGCLGVLETVILLLLPKNLAAVSEIMGALIAYRVIYYLIPLGIAALGLGYHELLHKKEEIKKVAQAIGQFVPHIAPHLISLTTFLAGVILLVSGSTPAELERLKWLKDFIPLPLIEVSHFLGSVIGAALLFLAWGLQKRLNGAYYLTLGLLSGGIIFSLLKGLDYEEAAILSAMLLAMIPCRRDFYRKTSLWNERFTFPWSVAVGIVLFSALSLGLFSYKHIEYSHDLWWRIAFFEDAPRFMRASVGSLGVIFLFSLARLLKPALPQVSQPTPIDYEKVKKIVQASVSTESNLALLGDKSFFLSESQNTFLMYGIEKNTWVALGDPVGQEEEIPELIWKFHETVDRFGGSTVFYGASKDLLYLYLDLGLAPFKIGEQAKVLLKDFSLEGKAHREFRHSTNQFEKQKCSFEIIPVEDVPRVMSELKKISAVWLAHKNTREKGFSLGFFSEEYLKNYSMAVIRKENKMIAFSNIWLSAGKEELSVDLMRYLADEAPPGVMDYLFIQLMLWGKAQGYRWFNLGVAPLSGLEGRSIAPVWNRLGAFLYRHGEHFYNFQGLRHYKDKFDPVWEPRYLVCPGGFRLPRILTDITALISGGLKGIVSK